MDRAPVAVTARPGLAPAATAGGPARELNLEFRGDASEYFRVWVVNLCLTLLTFGIFSAWAKVRKKRYLYSRTRLDGTPFQYLGQPIPILRGRILAAVLFGIYYLSTNFFTWTLPYVIAAGLVLAPWVLVRSAAFNARYTAWRNLTFRFDAGYVDAVKAIYVLGLIPAAAAGAVFAREDRPVIAGLTGVAFLLIALAFPWLLKRFKALIVTGTVYGGETGTFSLRTGKLYRIYLVAGLIVTAGGAVAGLTAVALSSFLKSEFGFLAATLPAYVGYAFAWAHAEARSTNLVWGGTRLGPIGFRSTLATWDLGKLYITNALAIVLSLGMLIPWAVIRTMRYRAENLRVSLDGALADFIGSESDKVLAAGGEMGEFFDLDVSL